MRKVLRKLIQKFPVLLLVAIGLVVFLMGRVKAQATSIAAVGSSSSAIEIVSQATQQATPAKTVRTDYTNRRFFYNLYHYRLSLFYLRLDSLEYLL